ncbi:MAG: flagellar biosynthetic protein FliO [Treponema sp.]|jgi:flagellar protein FliO/FliZ|nr:flagellar biosynthetic protein FliO [Treponema sp.]
MYSPRKHFGLYLGREKLEYFRIVLVIALSVGALLRGNSGLFAQAPEEPWSESTPVAGSGFSPIQSAERNIPIGEGTGNRASVRQGASFFTILRMILVLALAAAAIYGIVFFLKRISRHQEQRDPHLRVLAGAHLGSNRFVHVVSVGSKAWLVGASEGGVSLISEITDIETVDAMLLEASRKSAETGTGKLPDFAHLLSRLSGGEPSEIQPNLKAENVRKRRERLRGL